jgi:hypothetical protein
MRSRNFRYTVLETSSRAQGAACECPAVRELPPWADPLVARLLAKYRLQAALADSLSFLQNDQQLPTLPKNRLPPWGTVPANSDS